MAEACIIEVGHRDGARAVWRDLNAPHVVVCDRHRRQYDERPDLGPFAWAAIVGDENPNQGRGADPDRTEGEDAPRTATDAGIGGPHECVDGRVGHDHAGAQGEPKPAKEGDRASDPPGATYSANEIFQAACGIRDGAVITSMSVALALIARLHSNRVEAGA